MTPESWASLAFYVLAVLLIVSGIAVVTMPRIVHAALAMVFFFFVISGIYVLLGAPFIAATQVIIYIGAITVLFLFAIMLTHSVNLPTSNMANRQWIPAGVVAVLTLVTLYLAISGFNFQTTASPLPADATFALGQQLMGSFLVPFEAAGVLLLAAMVGAIVIGRES